jgi:hypothetical protein
MVEPKTLSLYYDPGTSLSKILYRIGNRGKLKFLTMEAETLDLPASSASTLPKECFAGKNSDRAWVRLSSNGDCHLIGRLALDYQASISIKKLKCKFLVPKILAAVAAIASDEKLPSTLNLELSVLLPFNEYNSRSELELDLSKAIKNFWFRDCNYQVNLIKYNSYIEGFGIACAQTIAIGMEQFRSQRLVYLMFGYRNTSLLFSRNGNLFQSESCSTKLGFYKSIDFTANKLSGLSREEIQSAIRTRTEGFYNPNTASREYKQVTEIVIDDLITTSDPSKIEREKEAIISAIEVAIEEYWLLLENWLDEALPPLSNLDGLTYCGGASEFLADRLSEYFKSKNKSLSLKPTEAISDSLELALELNSYQQKLWEKQNLGVRFADIWGLYQYFSDSKRASNRSANSSQSSAKKRTASKKSLVSK